MQKLCHKVTNGTIRHADDLGYYSVDRGELLKGLIQGNENGQMYILESCSNGIQEGKLEKSETHSEVILSSFYNSLGEKGGDPELK